MNKLTISQYPDGSADGPQGLPWELKGFDISVPDPEVVFFQPNRTRSRELAGALVGIAFFFSIIALGPGLGWLGMVGILTPSSVSPPFPTFTQKPVLYLAVTVLVLPMFAAVLSPLVLLFHDEIWNRLTPIILDKRQNQLLYGRRILCRLSEIDQVILRQVISDPAKRPPVYGVAVRLSSGRMIPFVRIKGMRYFLGPQEPNVTETFQEIAAFLGARFELRTEVVNSGFCK